MGVIVTQTNNSAFRPAPWRKWWREPLVHCWIAAIGLLMLGWSLRTT